MATVGGGGDDGVPVECLGVEHQAVHVENDSGGFAGQRRGRRHDLFSMDPGHRGLRHVASSLASRWISALLIAACRVGALTCAPSRSVT